eukprot:gene4633-2331_t
MVGSESSRASNAKSESASQYSLRSAIANLKNEDAFGDKNIGWIGSISLLFNNMTGPGIVSLVSIYQTGYASSTILFVLAMLWSGISCTLMIEAMSRVPGNKRFGGRVEFMYLSRLVMPKFLYFLTLVMFVFNLQTTNIASIIEAAQTTDNTLIAIKKSCALQFYNSDANVSNSGLNFFCSEHSLESASPFGSGAYVLSLGFLITIICCIPLGLINLDDNQGVQIASFVTLLFYISVIWLIGFSKETRYVPNSTPPPDIPAVNK